VLVLHCVLNRQSNDAFFSSDLGGFFVVSGSV
jgi:hypothetical protein